MTALLIATRPSPHASTGFISNGKKGQQYFDDVRTATYLLDLHITMFLRQIAPQINSARLRAQHSQRRHQAVQLRGPGSGGNRGAHKVDLPSTWRSTVKMP